MRFVLWLCLIALPFLRYQDASAAAPAMRGPAPLEVSHTSGVESPIAARPWQEPQPGATAAISATASSGSYLPIVLSPTYLYMPLVQTRSPFEAEFPPPNATRQSLNAFLKWRVEGAGPMQYTVLLEANDTTPDVTVSVGQTKTGFDPATFEPDTLYYWQVIGTRADGEVMRSPIWSFRTDFFPAIPEIGTMVTVPEGEFEMGCDPLMSGYYCIPGHGPLHKVWLSEYRIDKYEVTNKEYRSCVEAGACNMPRSIFTHRDWPYFYGAEYDYYPVMWVSNDDAVAYCAWVGKRVPTEAEWEKAARGSIDARPWPWGQEGHTCDLINTEFCVGNPTPVNAYPRSQSPYGAMNMAGNVNEHVQDYWYDFYPISPYVNPVNITLSENPPYKVVRGGSYRPNWFYSRVMHRYTAHWDDPPLYRSFRVGFRCAQSVPGAATAPSVGPTR
jgi:formylglycine-generating enzyme required for sulfatase activity